tara:strand:+ start:575 stop:799 length:225 start_codon:yes stop_codon:yes gene_type:complete
MSWNNANTEPTTSWSTTAEVQPNTSFTTSATSPDTSYDTTTTSPSSLTWDHFAYLLFADSTDKMWDQLEFQWGM